MPCYHPLKAFRSRETNPETGKHLITFNPVKNLVEGSSLTLPCGRCVGCRLERSRQWALRCEHETKMHPQNSFITLTFSKEHLPANYSVDVRDLQLFMKKLRKSLPHKIRFFACGEYGDLNLRPHYHALLFNHDFPDKILFKTTDTGDQLFTSPTLSKLWPYGHATTGAATFESAAYVARYVMKKINGDQAVAHYTRRNPDTGEFHVVKPEFIVMSRRPGIGTTWFNKFKSDVYPSDFIISRGKKMNPPKFYDKQLPEEELEQFKRSRKANSNRHREDNTPARLAVRETIKLSRIALLKRSLKDH